MKKVTLAQGVRAINTSCGIELSAAEIEVLRSRYGTADGVDLRYQEFCDDVDSGTWLRGHVLNFSKYCPGLISFIACLPVCVRVASTYVVCLHGVHGRITNAGRALSPLALLCALSLMQLFGLF